MKLIRLYFFSWVLVIAVVAPVAGAVLDDTVNAGLSNQWYIGLGAGTAFLQPNPVAPAIDPEENDDDYGTIVIGRDLSNLSSLQLQLHEMGGVALNNGEQANYQAVDMALLFRFFDTRDRQLVAGKVALALYGMASLGNLSRDIPSDISLKNESDFYLGYGAGAELFLGQYFSIRLQAAVIDDDAQYAALSVVTRFGNRKSTQPPANFPATSPRKPAARDEPSVSTQEATAATSTLSPPAAPPTPVPATPESRVVSDVDNDGVEDAVDQCADSAPGFPVRESGCAVFNGVLSGVKFAPGSTVLEPESLAQLDVLANVLKRYPAARIQIAVHTDTGISEREQAILTRARERAVGTYLLNLGIRANRLILRSMGGAVPVSDNATAEGRALNNRIEILEYR